MKINNTFFKPILFPLFLVILYVSGCTSNASNENNDTKEGTPSSESAMTKKQLRHVVLFKFKDSATTEDIKNVEAAFNALPDKITQIKSIEWGLNNSPEGLNKGFTHCFFLTFDSEEDRAVYLPHPDHKAFGKLLEPILDDVMVVDYWAN
jgi:hypothetical protein